VTATGEREGRGPGPRKRTAPGRVRGPVAFAVGVTFLLCTTPGAGAQPAPDGLAAGLARLWGDQPPPVPQDLAHLLWRMALDPQVEAGVLSRATDGLRPLTRDLLATLDWTEPLAQRALPDLFIVHTGGPPPGERPPTWADVRWVGLRLLRAIANPHATGRDERLQRDLDEALGQITRRTPSEVGGLVVLWDDWWADRGSDPAFYLDAAQVPNVDGWLASLAAPAGATGARTVLEMTQRMVDDPLRRHLLLDRLDAAHYAFLTAESIEIVKMFKEDFDARGVPFRHWDPELGRHVGYRAWDLRGAALDILEHTTGRMGSGVDEDQRILDWLYWWQRARFEARYYRDPRSGPTLEPWLGNLTRPVADGGRPIAPFLRDLYVAVGFQDLLLEQLRPEHRALVAELVEWLRKDSKQATDAGFEIAYRRFPLRPTPGEEGLLTAISWERVQALIRRLLTILTGVSAPAEGELPPEELNAFWWDWWRLHGRESQWYRGGVVTGAPEPPPFMPERAREE
jgi:hypothetical protein